MLRVVADGQERGLEWWTSAEIAAWERLRRQVSLAIRLREAASLQLELSAPASIPGFGVTVVAIAGEGGNVIATAGTHAVDAREITHHNQPAWLLTWDLPRGRSVVDVRW